MNRIVAAALCTCVGVGALAYSFGRSGCDQPDSEGRPSECDFVTETVQGYTSEAGSVAPPSDVQSEVVSSVEEEEPNTAQEPPAATEREGMKRLALQSSMEDGSLIDGVFFPQYDEETFRWTYRLDFDIEDGYFYVLSEGVAERGDQGCSESLVVDGVGYSRDTFDRENAVTFRLDDDVLDGYDVTETQFLEALLFSNANDLLSSIAVNDVAPDADGVWRVSLTAAEALAANEQENLLGIFYQLRGISDDTQVHLELVENDNGLISNLRLEFVDLGEPRTMSDGSVQQSQRSLQGELTIETVSGAEPRVTTSTPRPQFGYCADRTAGIAGEWKLKGYPESDAWFAIDEAGNISGFAACQSFSGTGEIGFDQLVDVELSIEGEACPDDGVTPDSHLVEALSANAMAGIYLGELVLYEPDGLVLLLVPK